MNKILQRMKNVFVEKVSEQDCILGAWDFGSELHGVSDAYSDVDIVLLVEGKQFKQIESTITTYLEQVSDEVLLCWPESFNNDAIINNCYLLLNEENIFQYDVFLLNIEKLDDDMCRIHYSNIEENNWLKAMEEKSTNSCDM